MRLHSLVPLAALALAAVAGSGSTQTPGPPTLVWPVACQVGTTCAIQHYVDRDPSAAVEDFACGSRSYEGHDGVDIRVPDLAAQRRGVAVMAAADGRVFGVRDGVADVLANSAGAPSVEGIECGNRVFVAHSGGFVTGYCHLAKGSVAVKDGDQVKAGQRLGAIGMSGAADFPHVHFAISEGDRHVDPFAYGATEDSCRGGRSLWRDTPAYEARVILNTGFAPATLTMESVENGGIAPPTAASDIMVAYARAIGLKAGDIQSMTIKAPDGSTFFTNTAEALPRNQAQRLMFGGRRKPPAGWPKGRYEATYTVSAGGQTVLTRRVSITL